MERKFEEILCVLCDSFKRVNQRLDASFLISRKSLPRRDQRCIRRPYIRFGKFREIDFVLQVATKTQKIVSRYGQHFKFWEFY